MIVPDVNVLVYAHRVDAAAHAAARALIESELGAGRPVGLADAVVSGFLRIVTHPRVFATPTPLDDAFGAIDDLLRRPEVTILRPRNRHWELFRDLCRRADARGNRVPDAHLAALAIEWSGELVSTDRGFARFPDLRWRALTVSDGD
jgi:toxin-antitoxin system PIN domain toxin